MKAKVSKFARGEVGGALGPEGEDGERADEERPHREQERQCRVPKDVRRGPQYVGIGAREAMGARSSGPKLWADAVKKARAALKLKG